MPFAFDCSVVMNTQNPCLHGGIASLPDLQFLYLYLQHCNTLRIANVAYLILPYVSSTVGKLEALTQAKALNGS